MTTIDFDLDCFESTLERIKEHNERMRQNYPRHHLEARALINKYLKRLDITRYKIFNGQAPDDVLCLGDIHIAHDLVADILKSRDEGINIPKGYLDKAVRGHLGFPTLIALVS